MKFKEYCNNFYYRRNEGALRHYASQAKIPDFLMKAAMGEDKWNEISVGESARIKWMSEGQNPGSEIWKAIQENYSEERFATELQKELVDTSKPAFVQLAERFGLYPKGIDRDCFARALAAQFKAISDGEGEATNLVHAVYNSLIGIAKPREQEQSSPQFEVIKKTPQTDAEPVKIKPEYLYFTRRNVWLFVGGSIVVIGLLLYLLLTSRNSAKYTANDDGPHLYDGYIYNYLADATTTDKMTDNAESLYDSAKLNLSYGSTTQKNICSALLKYNAINRDVSQEQLERLATQGLNICQTVLDSEKDGTFFYKMAIILRCHFYNSLEYSIDNKDWKAGIKTVERFLASEPLDMHDMEDALLSSYGYAALSRYYGAVLATDYKSNTEELYRKYVEYYDTGRRNRFAVAYSVGLEPPAFDIEEFTEYSENLFRLISKKPSMEYLPYLYYVNDTCDEYLSSRYWHLLLNDYDGIRMTAIKADVCYHLSLIAEKEVDEYNADYVETTRDNSVAYFDKVLEARNLNDWRIMEIMLQSALRMCNYDMSWNIDDEDLIYMADTILNVPEWGVTTPEKLAKAKSTAAYICYRILVDNNYISDEIADLGLKLSEHLTPLDTYDLILNKKDITDIKDYFEHCPREDDYLNPIAD